MAQYGLTEHDVTDAMATALPRHHHHGAGTQIRSQNRRFLSVVAQTPEYRLDTLSSA